MSDVFDYLEWRGDIEVSQVPLGAVDFLTICCFSYFPYDGIIPRSIYASPVSFEYAVNQVVKLTGSEGDGRIYHLKEDEPLAKKLLECPRFMKLDVTGFVNVIDYDKEEQFAAFTIILPDKSPLVVFRGTDRNMVGWKEDFNMAFNKTVPAQLDAMKYLNQVANQFEGPIRICGHSKGGNLAIYSAVYCNEDVQKRIKEVWNMDGPGFLENQTDRPEFKRIEGRLHSYVPQLSIVGMMFEHAENFQVVKSDGKLFWQHSLYTWKVKRGDCEVVPELEKFGRRFNKIVKQWLRGLDYSTRQTLVEGLFEITGSAGISRVEDFLQLKTKYNLVKAFGKLDSEKRKIMMEAVKVFYGAVKSVFKYEKAQKRLEKLSKLEELAVADRDEEQNILNVIKEFEDEGNSFVEISTKDLKYWDFEDDELEESLNKKKGVLERLFNRKNKRTSEQPSEEVEAWLAVNLQVGDSRRYEETFTYRQYGEKVMTSDEIAEEKREFWRY